MSKMTEIQMKVFNIQTFREIYLECFNKISNIENAEKDGTTEEGAVKYN